MKVSWDWVVIGIVMVLLLGFALSSCAYKRDTRELMICAPFTKAKFSDGSEIDAGIIPSQIILR